MAQKDVLNLNCLWILLSHVCRFLLRLIHQKLMLEVKLLEYFIEKKLNVMTKFKTTNNKYLNGPKNKE
jgi:hypothetical protein